MFELLDKLYLSGSDVYPEEPLRRWTSLAIGGKARALILPNSEKALLEAISILRKAGCGFRIMGMGTNLLVSDEGIPDFIINTSRLTGVHIEGNLVVADAGVPLKRLCQMAASAGLSGLEQLYGIPGSIGGAVFMNAGAYGKEVKDVLEWAELFDGDRVVRLDASKLGLAYRRSNIRKRLILKAAFRLKRDEPDMVWKRMDEFLRRRLEKQPVFERSAGSLFKRPKPDFYVGSTLEKLGLKGFRVGDMMISTKHAGFMINTGNGTFVDAINLIDYVKRRVKETHGVELETEVIIWK